MNYIQCICFLSIDNMDYTLNSFKHTRGVIYTTSDFHKYIISKRKTNTVSPLYCPRVGNGVQVDN